MCTHTRWEPCAQHPLSGSDRINTTTPIQIPGPAHLVSPGPEMPTLMMRGAPGGWGRSALKPPNSPSGSSTTSSACPLAGQAAPAGPLAGREAAGAAASPPEGTPEESGLLAVLLSAVLPEPG